MAFVHPLYIDFNVYSQGKIVRKWKLSKIQNVIANKWMRMRKVDIWILSAHVIRISGMNDSVSF